MTRQILARIAISTRNTTLARRVLSAKDTIRPGDVLKNRGVLNIVENIFVENREEHRDYGQASVAMVSITPEGDLGKSSITIYKPDHKIHGSIDFRPGKINVERVWKKVKSKYGF